MYVYIVHPHEYYVHELRSLCNIHYLFIKQRVNKKIDNVGLFDLGMPQRRMKELRVGEKEKIDNWFLTPHGSTAKGDRKKKEVLIRKFTVLV